MKLLEYEAKSILLAADIATPRQLGVVLVDNRSSMPLIFPAILKSQVPIGGRGKLGGIQIVASRDEFADAVDRLFSLDIKGHRPKSLLVEEVLDITHEYYLSMVLNRRDARIDIMAHPEGGVEIEAQTANDFLTHSISPSTVTKTSELLAELYDIPDKSFVIEEFLANLYDCFVRSDATLIEINPLMLTADSRLIAGDCKMTLDDAASFRHPEWDFEEQASDTNFVSLNQRGTIATIANGAGLAMATVDTVAQRGLTPANFLDIGGGATVESIMKSFRQIMEFPDVTHIVINIFGGIVQCDKVAKAIMEAKEQLPHLPKLLIRLSGTNADLARELLAEHNVPLFDSLDDALDEATV